MLAGVLCDFGFAALHLACAVFSFFCGGIVYHWLGWVSSSLFLARVLFTFGVAGLHLARGLFTFGLVALHLAWVFFNFG